MVTVPASRVTRYASRLFFTTPEYLYIKILSFSWRLLRLKKKIFILLSVLLVLLAFFLRSYLWFFLGNKSCDKRDYGKAISYYDKALNISPGFSSALLKKSFMLFFTGKNKEACECLDRLIDMNPGLKGVNVNFSIYNYKPLHIISVMGHKKMAELLIEHGADVNARDDGGRDPLYFALRENHMDLVVLFIEKGADINNGEALLHNVAQKGCKKAVELLIEKGLDVNAPDKYGETPLYCAVAHKEIVELLIEKGANINGSHKDGETLLHRAAGQGSKDVVELLIEKGLDVNARDKDGKTPLDIAVEQNKKEIVEFLWGKGLKPDVTALLHSAVLKGHNDVAEFLIEKEVKLNDSIIDGRTIFHNAVTGGNTGLVKLLIEKGARVNTVDMSGKTPLHSAVNGGNYNIVKLLIKKGAHVNVSDLDGKTPLHYAAEEYFCESITELLIKNGADVNAMDKRGETPLDIAISRTYSNNEKLREILVKYGGKTGKKEGGK